MSITKTVGGDRLGSGKKLKTTLHGYERSTHNLSKVARTSMTQGTLVPLYVEFMQKGDTWDIDLESIIRTHPTNGPIFGSYKFQVDVFTADIRLYNKQLHNNIAGLGMRMQDVIFPVMSLNGKNPINGLGDLNQQQIAPDSLLAYLGIRGLGTHLNINAPRVNIERNAMPLLMYWDIYKDYYSNKQEQEGVVITPDVQSEEGIPMVSSFEISGIDGVKEYQNVQASGFRLASPQRGYDLKIIGTNLGNRTMVIRWSEGSGGGSVYPTYIEIMGSDQTAPHSTWEEVEVDPSGEFILYKGYMGNPCTMLPYDGTGTTRDMFVWDGTTKAQYYNGIALTRFQLSEIDEMREKIFAQPKNYPLILGSLYDEQPYMPYLASLGQTHGDLDQIYDDSNMYSYYPLAGLGIKTYQSDRFQNWLSKEWIQQVNNISAVATDTGSFTMDALNLAKKVYELENRIAVSGGTYEDWLEAVYGDKVYERPEMPVYRGGMQSEIVFEEVVSTAEVQAGTESQPLGTLAGRGVQRMEKGGKIRIRAEEHGFIIIIASITPRIDYSQGNKWWTKLKTMDDIHKPQLDSIGFQDLLTDEFAAFDTKVFDDGTEEFHSVGKQPSWTQYTTNCNEVYGNFAREYSEQWMILSRRYENNEQLRLSDATTYIDPTKFNYPFANLKLEASPFWVQLGVEAKVRRQMSANQMPNI